MHSGPQTQIMLRETGDPTKRKAWDRGVEAIETHRQRHGIKNLIGRSGGSGTERGSEKPCDGFTRPSERSGLDPMPARERALGRSLGIGR
jgi:hypothetical protein